ncbi:hypothetical protein ACW2QC_09290 [Virgibacillus sp. FSP13]
MVRPAYEIRTDVLNDISHERDRQDYKWGMQRHDYGTWLKILVEEVGEVAQAMQVGMVSEKVSDADNLYDELVQVAAVATAIAEQVKENDQ